jgi:hypothetical protein
VIQLRALLAIFAFVAPALATAQDTYPGKPIQLIVP